MHGRKRSNLVSHTYRSFVLIEMFVVGGGEICSENPENGNSETMPLIDIGLTSRKVLALLVLTNSF